MPVIMWAYTLISAFLVVLLFWNFLREKTKVDDMLLYLIVLIPLLLRVMRIK